MTNARTATIGFTVSEPATANCRLDNDDLALAVLCTSPRSYTNLSAGRHTVTVTATDPAGNTGQATADWSVVLPAAAVTLTASPTTITYGQAAT